MTSGLAREWAAGTAAHVAFARFRPGSPGTCLAGWFARPDASREGPVAATETRFFAANGIIQHAVLAGPAGARPVLLVHGLGWDHTLWGREIDGLAAGGWRVIAVDLRGMGQTDKPDVAYSIDLYVADMAALLDALALEQVAVVGFSLGGMIALAMAARLGVRIGAGLVACCAPASTAEAAAATDAMLARALTLGPRRFAEEQAEAIWSPDWAREHPIEVQRFVDWRAGMDQEALARAFRAAYGVDLRLSSAGSRHRSGSSWRSMTASSRRSPAMLSQRPCRTQTSSSSRAPGIWSRSNGRRRSAPRSSSSSAASGRLCRYRRLRRHERRGRSRHRLGAVRGAADQSGGAGPPLRRRRRPLRHPGRHRGDAGELREAAPADPAIGRPPPPVFRDVDRPRPRRAGGQGRGDGAQRRAFRRPRRGWRAAGRRQAHRAERPRCPRGDLEGRRRRQRHRCRGRAGIAIVPRRNPPLQSLALQLSRRACRRRPVRRPAGSFTCLTCRSRSPG